MPQHAGTGVVEQADVGRVEDDGAPVRAIRRRENVDVGIMREDGARHGASGAFEERDAVLYLRTKIFLTNFISS